MVPGVVLAHGRPLNGAPSLRLAVQRERPSKRVEQSPSSVVRERESRGAGVARRIVTNGVGEAAHAPHHRQGAVAETVHLVETAGLKLRGHQEDVCAALDQMREAFVKADVCGDLLWISRG